MPIQAGCRAVHWPAGCGAVSDPCFGRILVQGRTPVGLALNEPDEGVDIAGVEQLGLLPSSTYSYSNSV